jgi:protein ImuB
VLVAVEQLTPWVEVLQPGECAFPARGAARYHGGEPALAVTVTAAVHAAVEGRGQRRPERHRRPEGGLDLDQRGLGRGGCQVGIADGTFAAGLAARSQAIVPPGGSRAFLAPLSVATLDRPDLADLLVRLGLRTLGDLAALPRADLATRFGAEGARAARLASGLDEHPKGARRPPPDLRVAAELDPPADRVDVAAFTAKTLADDLVARLDRLGLACTRLRIEAQTDQGETLSRVWRYDPTPTASTTRRPSGPDPVPRSVSGGAPRPGPADGPGRVQRSGPADTQGRMAAVMTERVRWQLDGWLTGRTGRLPGALTHLVLVPDEVVPDRGRQLGFWGEETEAGQRAARALARIQGLLGPEAVHTAHLRGGRDPADRVALTPAADPSPSSPPGSNPLIPDSRAPNSRVLDFRVPDPTPLDSPVLDPTTLGSPVSDPTTSDPTAFLLPRIPGHSRPGIPAPGIPGQGPAGALSHGSSDAPGHGSPGASGYGPPGARGLGPVGTQGHGPVDVRDLSPVGAQDHGPPGPQDHGPTGAQSHGPPGVPGPGPGDLRGAVPWPGQVPAPAPAIVYAEPLPAEVVDATGATVAVDGRGLLGSLPTRARIRGRAWSAITAWAGPWLVDERWWDPAAHRRLVRLQATTDQGAYLLRLTGGRWWVEAIYD